MKRNYSTETLLFLVLYSGNKYLFSLFQGCFVFKGKKKNANIGMPLDIKATSCGIYLFLFYINERQFKLSDIHWLCNTSIFVKDKMHVEAEGQSIEVIGYFVVKSLII
jgi:hypothetical protein